MNTRYLTALCAVAETGSIAGAARRLHLASTTVAEQIRALEADLDAVLVLRSGRTLILSDAGQAMLADARSVLDKLEDIRQIVRLEELRGVLRVGSISTALTTFVPQALRDMANRHPGIEVKLLPATSTHLFEKLDRGELDCAITGLPPFPLPKSYIWHPIREEPLVLIAPPQFAGDDPLTLLRSRPFIRMERNTWTGQLVSSFLSDHRIQPVELFELSAQHTIAILVALGLGVALVPNTDMFVTDHKPVRKITAGDHRHVRHLGLLGKAKARSQLIKAFAHALIFRCLIAQDGVFLENQ